MAKKDLIADATKRGLKLSGDETVAQLKALLSAAGEAEADVDAEAGDAVDAIDADIAALTAQLADKLKARAASVSGVALTAAQADDMAQQEAAKVAALLEDRRRQDEHDATQESLARSRDAGGTTTTHGVFLSSGCI